MKKSLLILFVVSLLVSGQLFASSVANVELSHIPGFTVARIDVEGPVRFTHQTEEAKDGKPFRVIVDVLSATHDLGANNFFSLPTCPIKAVRSSQYTVKPEKIARVVFDTDRERIYRIESDEHSIQILFPDKATQQFSAWSSSAVVAAIKAEKKKSAPVVAEKSAPAKSPPAKTAAQLNKSIDNDRMLSLSDKSKPAPAKTTVAKAEPPKTVKRETKPQKTSWRTGQMSDSKPKSTAATASKESVKRASLVDVPYGPDVDWAVLKEDREAAAQQKAKAASKSVVAVKDRAPAEKPVVEKPASAKTQPVKKKSAPAVKPPATVKSAPPKAPAQSGKGMLASTSPAEKSSSVKKKSSPAPAKSSQMASADKKNTGKKKSTSRFRRSPADLRKIKGTLVAQFPKRLVIKYKASKYRDPFETLINETRTYNNPIEKRVANVEGLRLVGIIESGTSKNSALFEDKEGYGYILKTGDKVQKGYVLRVEEDRVYFQIFEYGWSRTVALNLEN